MSRRRLRPGFPSVPVLLLLLLLFLILTLAAVLLLEFTAFPRLYHRRRLKRFRGFRRYPIPYLILLIEV
jgi:hypothetical protein